MNLARLRIFCFFGFVLLIGMGCSSTSSKIKTEPDGEVAGTQAQEPQVIMVVTEEGKKKKGVVHKLVLYIPNRVFDVLDLVRARVRVGPGLSGSLRATKPASVFIGSHSSMYVGLRGPRGRPEIPWPFGVDKLTGIQISVIDETDNDPDKKFNPRYGPAEIGLGGQLVILGVDVGVEPWEAVDLVLGLVFVDVRKDDS